eukprot:CAMPEP_0197072230 /NCGR_PEP_ID=MMETSP1384-20130603/209992_1 /TAXON_ID=29189 /ORGANISM="Ammonia sp." /LENGTH=288 /DNA_ID=CAMNT_0042511047 /DNA_START=39 /DNA_END=906 /DNA_ORIENTATION=+
MELTKKSLLKHCREMNMYSTPELNDRLYLHQKGICKIENLDEYTGIRVLWLQQNGIEEIENLHHLQQLKHLYLNENMIKRINGAQSLQHLPDLDTLNLEKNYIKHIETDDLSHLSKLNTLNLAHNRLCDMENVRGLLRCPSLCVLDLRNNNLEVSQAFIHEILSKLPNLRVLYLMNSSDGNNENRISEQLKCYRKMVIAKCANLRHLDERPVFEDEGDAVMRGAAEALKRKQQANHAAFGRLIEEAKHSKAKTKPPISDDKEDDDDDEVQSSAADTDDHKDDTKSESQ